jgi:hypothetical protein
MLLVVIDLDSSRIAEGRRGVGGARVSGIQLLLTWNRCFRRKLNYDKVWS